MAKSVIKYQDTTVAVERTVAELSALIKKYGGSRFEQQWTPDGGVSGVRRGLARDARGAHGEPHGAHGRDTPDHVRRWAVEELHASRPGTQDRRLE